MFTFTPGETKKKSKIIRRHLVEDFIQSTFYLLFAFVALVVLYMYFARRWQHLQTLCSL